MAIGKVQSVTGDIAAGTATLTLNGVGSGNLLTLQLSYLRGVSTVAPIPTDTGGTLVVSVRPALSAFLAQFLGTAVFHEASAAAGTHAVTITLTSGDFGHATLTEWSNASGAPLDVSTSAASTAGGQTSQATGTTGATTQADEVSLIQFCDTGSPGAANMGLTNPVSGFTTLYTGGNTASDIGFMQAFEVLNATGTQAATFNWTDNSATQTSAASIVTFMGSAAVAITGTATTGINENSIVSGGKTVIATVSGDTFVPLSSTAVIALRGTPKANNLNAGANVVLTFDVNANAPQTNDWVIVFGGHGNSVTSLLPPGQNAVNDGTYTNVTNHTGGNCIFGVWKKKMGATPDLKVTCSGGGNANDAVAYAAYVFHDMDPTTSEDATVVVNNASSTNPNPASITTVTNGAVVLAIAGSQVNDNTPGNVTGYSNQITSNINANRAYTVSAMLKTVATAGAEDPAAFSTWSTGLWQTATVALRPRVDSPFNNVRQNLINGMNSAQSEAHGWQNEVRAKIPVTDVVRTNNTVITVTLDAEAAYDITATETITVTVPAVMITGNFPLVGSPTFTITAVGGVTIKYTQLEHAFLRGAFRGIALGVR